MQVGIISQAIRQQDMAAFNRAAKRKKINLIFLAPSSLAMLIKNNRLTLLHNNRPLNLNGLINWEPYPVFDELEKVCSSLDIPFVNRTEAVRAARNKMLTSLALFSSSLPQPDTCYLYSDIKTGLVQLGIPLVYKPKTGTRGRGALLLKSDAQIPRFAAALSGKHGLYLQSYIPNHGFDIRVAVVGTRVLGAIKKTAAPGEWRTHVAYGGTTSAYPVTRELEQLSLQAVKALGLDFAGIDIMVDSSDGSYKILEANAVPGLAIFEQTTGKCIAEAILSHLQTYWR